MDREISLGVRTVQRRSHDDEKVLWTLSCDRAEQVNRPDEFPAPATMKEVCYLVQKPGPDVMPALAT